MAFLRWSWSVVHGLKFWKALFPVEAPVVCSIPNTHTFQAVAMGHRGGLWPHVVSVDELRRLQRSVEQGEQNLQRHKLSLIRSGNGL